MDRIGIIHNPFAKGNLKRPWISEKLRELVEPAGVLRETKNINELPRVAEEFIEQGVNIIGVNGGDGTLHLTLTAFLPVYGDRPFPRVMSLRGGTMNTMANSLKIKGQTLRIVKAAVEQIKAGRPFEEKPQHLIKVNGKFGFMSGAGIIAKFLDIYYSGSNPGPAHAAKLVARTIGSAMFFTRFSRNLFSSTPARLVVEGERIELEEYTVILACVIKEAGLGFTPTPRACDRLDHFHLLAGDIRPYQVLPRVPSLWFGRDITHPRIVMNRPVREMVIEPVGKLRWMVDGEMYDTTEPLHYSVGPTVRVVAPSKKK